MAETSQYKFNFQEVAAALLKEQNVHDGLWVLGFGFNFTVGLMGPSPETAGPATLIQVQDVILSRHPMDQPRNPMVVDAAELNPKRSKASTKLGQSKSRA